MEVLMGLLVFVIAILGLWFVLWLCVVVPYETAIKRDRDGVFWVLVSIIGSPILAILLLWYLGTAYYDVDDESSDEALDH